MKATPAAFMKHINSSPTSPTAQQHDELGSAFEPAISCATCNHDGHSHGPDDTHEHHQSGQHAYDHSHDKLPSWPRIALALSLALAAELAHWLQEPSPGCTMQAWGWPYSLLP